MKTNRCLAHCGCTTHRRAFLKKTSFITAGALLWNYGALKALGGTNASPDFRQFGKASTYTPRIKAAFVRRKGEYGMRWPGAVYDGAAAQEQYTKELTHTAQELDMVLDLKPVPLHSLAEAEQWLDDAHSGAVDGLVLIVLDRQEHSWPSAEKTAKSGIPAVIFSPLGTSFTTNTVRLADQPGAVVYSTNDFSQPAFGMKMLKAGARMKRSRCVVIKGDERRELPLADTGITLQYIPADTFISIYRDMPVSEDIVAMADDYIRQAADVRHATRQDVINGIKSYRVAGKILELEQADAISMDCLGALGNSDVSLPCISWSRMNDEGIPAACEADIGAIAAQIIVQYLFDRPGFQQDPVADTSDDTIIGAHCSCPTRLHGFKAPSEPFELVHHHGNRDAVPRTIWKKGERVTCLDLLPADGKKLEHSQLLISKGKVVDNMHVPPSGGCVVSVKVKFDDAQPVLSYPGFHQLFFYGDHTRQLRDFSQLMHFDAKLV